MAVAKDKPPTEPRRRNRTVAVGEAIAGALDPALKRRGFASRDILANWPAMAPKPYDRVSLPDKLSWPRGERSAEGATLFLRCTEGHRLALAHEAPRVAAAVNRYFGYVLVKEVRLSPMPFVPPAPAAPPVPVEPDPMHQARIGDAVNDVADPLVREALRVLGLALAARRKG